MIDPRWGEKPSSEPSDSDTPREETVIEPELIGGMPLEDFVPEGHAPHAPTENVGTPPGGKGCSLVLLAVAVTSIAIAAMLTAFRSDR